MFLKTHATFFDEIDAFMPTQYQLMLEKVKNQHLLLQEYCCQANLPQRTYCPLPLFRGLNFTPCLIINEDALTPHLVLFPMNFQAIGERQSTAKVYLKLILEACSVA